MDALTASGRGLRLGALALLVLGGPGCGPDPEPPAPEQEAVFAEAVDAELVVITATNAMRYQTTRIEAPAGSRVRLVVDNSATTSPSMVHNVVVLDSADPAVAERVGRAAAGAADNLPNDPAIVAATPLAGPGERRAVVFTVPPAGEYTFLCTYPGHFQFMRGTLVSGPPEA